MVVSALKCDTMDYTNTKDKTASFKFYLNIEAVGVIGVTQFERIVKYE